MYNLATAIPFFRGRVQVQNFSDGRKTRAVPKLETRGIREDEESPVKKHTLVKKASTQGRVDTHLSLILSHLAHWIGSAWVASDPG